MCRVAPLVGAWIEILMEVVSTVMTTVAPLVGAWIEILELFATACGFLVAPLVGAWIEIQLIHFWVTERIVAPLVGAWIEINKAGRYVSFAMSLLSWERGLKYISVLDKWYWNQRRSSRGSVDWNIFQCWTNDIEISRSSRGSVDWNKWCISSCTRRTVAPLVGAWIEIGSGKAGGARGNTVAPLVGAWIEI